VYELVPEEHSITVDALHDAASMTRLRELHVRVPWFSFLLTHRCARS
jgi:hypothetical protein